MAIAYVGGAKALSNAADLFSLSVNYTPTIGNYVVAMVQLAAGNAFTDVACATSPYVENLTYSGGENIPASVGIYVVYQFVCPVLSSSITAFNFSWTGGGGTGFTGSDSAVVTVAEYSGVGGVGTTNYANGTTSYYPSIATTNTVANSWIVGVLAADNTQLGGNGFFADVGNLRLQECNTVYCCSGVFDNTAATTPASVTITGQLEFGSPWAALTIELLPQTLPQVTTEPESNIGYTTTTGVGDITFVGAAFCSLVGFVWDTVSHASNPGNVAPISSGYPNVSTVGGEYTLGLYSLGLTGFSLGQTYYTRAVVENGLGYAYGNEVSFTMLVYKPSLVQYGLGI